MIKKCAISCSIENFLVYCDKLTLIMMYGEKREIVEKGKTVRCVLAADWLREG